MCMEHIPMFQATSCLQCEAPTSYVSWLTKAPVTSSLFVYHIPVREIGVIFTNLDIAAGGLTTCTKKLWVSKSWPPESGEQINHFFSHGKAFVHRCDGDLPNLVMSK